MTNEKFRYFIELQPEGLSTTSRNEENELRRQQALAIITQLRDWIHEKGFDEKVGGLSSTAFGQVQITCAPDVMQQIREDEAMPIAAVRQGSLISWVAQRA